MENPVQLLRTVIRSNFFKDTNKVAMGTVIAQGIGLAVSPIIARLFAPEDFGVFSVLVALASILGVLVTLRVDMLVVPTKKTTDAIHFFQAAALFASAFCLLCWALILVFPAQIMSLLSVPAQGHWALFLMPILFVTHTCFLVIRALCVRFRLFAAISKSLIVRAILQAGLWIGLGLAIRSAPIGLILMIGQVVGILAFIYIASKALPAAHRKRMLVFRWDKVKQTLSAQKQLIGSIGLSQIFSALNQRLPVIIIGIAFGPISAGFYALAERIVLSPAAFVSAALSDVYRQRASQAFREGRPFDKLLRQVAAIAALLSFIIFVPAWFILPWGLPILFGANWAGISFTISMLIINVAVSFFTMPVDATAVIVGAKKYMMAWHGTRFLTFIIAAIAAMMGWFSYEDFLIYLVITKVILFGFDLFMMNRFAIKGKGW